MLVQPLVFFGFPDCPTVLDQDTLTQGKIWGVVEKVMKWKQLCKTLNKIDAEEKVEAIESELGWLMVSLDRRVKPTLTQKSSMLSFAFSLPVLWLPAAESLCVTQAALKCLATEEDIDIINLYHDCFNPSAGNTSQLVAQLNTVPVKFGTRFNGTDPGIEVELAIPPNLLSQRLGFWNGTPLLFNYHQHKGGLTSWELLTPPPSRMWIQIKILY